MAHESSSPSYPSAWRETQTQLNLLWLTGKNIGLSFLNLSFVPCSQTVAALNSLQEPF